MSNNVDSGAKLATALEYRKRKLSSLCGFRFHHLTALNIPLRYPVVPDTFSQNSHKNCVRFFTVSTILKINFSL